MTHPDDTILSGQVFLWEKHNDSWYGIDGSIIIRVDKNGGMYSSGGVVPDFFRDSDDRDNIHESLLGDPVLAGLVHRYPYLRITRQDFFQCMISFIVSANSNIPRIRRSLFRLCEKFGRPLEYDGMAFHTFPDPASLASAQIRDIWDCGTGYRSPYIRGAAEIAQSLDIDSIRSMPYPEARAYLCDVIPGVGDKVADCIMLFSLDFLEAIPLDRWIARVIHDMYGIGDGSPPVTKNRYTQLHNEIVGRLGEYAGYAQQYMFKAARDDSSKPLKW